VSDLRNEVLNVTNFFSGVRQEVLSVLLNPGGDGLVESVDERLGHDLKPSDIVDELLSVDVVLNGVEVLDLLVEFAEVGLAGGHAIEDLLVHEVESVHSILHVVLVVFLVFTNVDSVLLLVVDFSKVITTFEEKLEGFLNILLPEEIPLSVLVEELLSLVGDLVHVVLDVLEGSEKDELILDFNEVIAGTTVLVIEAGNLDGDGDEVADNFVDDVSNAGLSVVALERGDEVQIGVGAVNEVDLNLEDRGPHVVDVGLDVDLLAKVLHGGVNGDGDSLNEEAVAEVNVAEPVGALLVGLNVIKSVSEELVDLLTLLADIVLAGLDGGGVEVDNCVRLHGLLTLEERLVPGGHDGADLADVLLHLLDEDVDLSDDLHAVGDEGVNSFGAPLKGLYTRLEGVHHEDDSVLEEGLLDGEEVGEHVVVHLDDELELAGLLSVDVDSLVEGLGSLGDLDVQK
jgi:hypothetical protein